LLERKIGGKRLNRLSPSFDRIAGFSATFTRMVIPIKPSTQVPNIELELVDYLGLVKTCTF